jgi:hypothetical protein
MNIENHVENNIASSEEHRPRMGATKAQLVGSPAVCYQRSRQIDSIFTSQRSLYTPSPFRTIILRLDSIILHFRHPPKKCAAGKQGFMDNHSPLSATPRNPQPVRPVANSNPASHSMPSQRASLGGLPHLAPGIIGLHGI